VADLQLFGVQQFGGAGIEEIVDLLI